VPANRVLRGQVRAKGLDAAFNMLRLETPLVRQAVARYAIALTAVGALSAADAAAATPRTPSELEWSHVAKIAPALDASTWDVSCTAESTCVAAGDDHTGALVFFTADPRTHRPWAAARLQDAGQLVSAGSVSCPSPSFCAVLGEVVTDNNAINGGLGNIVIWTTTNPSGGSAAWVPTEISQTAQVPAFARTISCPTQNFCATVGPQGLLVSSNPTASAASAWSDVPQPTNGVRSLTCPSATLCLTINSITNDLGWSTSPTDSASWQRYPLGLDPDSIACASPSFCMIDGENDATLTHIAEASTSPTNAAGWRPVSDGSTAARGYLSCLSPAFCASISPSGELYTSATPATRWDGPTYRTPSFRATTSAFSCASVVLCVATSDHSKYLVGTPAATISAPRRATVEQFRRGLMIKLTGLAPNSAVSVALVARSATFAAIKSRADRSGTATLLARMARRAMRKFGAVQTPPAQLLRHRTLTVKATVIGSSLTRRTLLANVEIH
jgi:hypothetical protein